ncbi:hypothetical protein J3F84DRAFT_380035 [Trichoderma pleuroticola]
MSICPSVRLSVCYRNRHSASQHPLADTRTVHEQHKHSPRHHTCTHRAASPQSQAQNRHNELINQINQQPRLK